MQLLHLSNQELLEKTKWAADREREASTILLHHLNEVERRRLFAEAGFSSLFEYCVRALQMSDQQAARRINAARALRDFPEMEEKLNSGSLSLTALSQAQSMFKKVGLEKIEKQEILSKLEGETSRKVVKILAGYAPEEPKKDTIRVVTSELTELKLTVDEEVMKDLQRLKELWSHELPNASLGDLLRKMAKYCRKSLDPLEKSTGVKKSTPAPELKPEPQPELKPEPQPELKPELQPKLQEPKPGSQKLSRYISVQIRNEVMLRDKGACTYINKEGRRCNSRYFLEFDHIKPFAKGGGSSAENLRLRCRAHNQLYAIRHYGEEKILTYGKRRL